MIIPAIFQDYKDICVIIQSSEKRLFSILDSII